MYHPVLPFAMSKGIDTLFFPINLLYLFERRNSWLCHAEVQSERFPKILCPKFVFRQQIFHSSASRPVSILFLTYKLSHSEVC